MGREWHYQLKDKRDKVELIACGLSQLDISDFQKTTAVIETEKPDVVINCAAYTKVDLAETERDTAERINADAVKNIAEACKAYHAKLVHYSTDYIFAGKKEDQSQLPNGYPEDYSSNPVNWYGQTKWLGEQAIRSSECDHIIIRLSWLCGAFGPNFVTTMLKLAENHDQLTVVNDQLASPTFTHDVVPKTLQLINQNLTGTYHITCSGLISWADFATEVFKLANKPVEVQPIPSSEYKMQAKRPQFSKLDTAKIETVANISIIYWKVGLRAMLDDLNIR